MKPTQEHQDCGKLARFLSAYVDGELAAKICAKIDSHKKECRACRRFLKSFQGAVELLRTAPTRRPPRELREKLRKKLDKKS